MFLCYVYCLFHIKLASHDLKHGEEYFSVDLRTFARLKTDIVSFGVSCEKSAIWIWFYSCASPF